MKRLGLLAIAGALSLASTAEAFDNGPHWTSTSLGLERSKFSYGAQKRVWIAGNLVDHWLNLAKKLEEYGLDGAGEGKFIAAQHEKLTFFHFDLLKDAYAVEAYTAWLEKATKATLKRCATGQRRVGCIQDLLGITLHAVQDLYAHSTLANQDWFSWTGAEFGQVGEPTYFSIPEEIRRSPLVNLETGEPGPELFGLDGLNGKNGSQLLPGHGSHDTICTSLVNKGSALEFYDACGYNHDSHIRPNYARAHNMAIAATNEWAQKVRGWLADEDLWKSVTTTEANFTNSCWNKYAYAASGAGYWGYPTEIRTVTVLASQLKICSDIWEDLEWLPVVNDLLSVAGHPQDYVKPDKSVSYAKVVERSGDSVVNGDFLGTYAVNFADQTGKLTITSSTNGRATGKFTVDGQTDNWNVSAFVVGASFDFELRFASETTAAPPRYIGHAYLATHGKKSLAGTITKNYEVTPNAKPTVLEFGIPTGFVASKS